MNLSFQSGMLAASENTLINAIYDAAIHPQLWSQVLDAIRLFCGADQCTVFFYDVLDRHHNYAAAARLKVQVLDLYLDEFIAPQAAQFNNQLRCLPEGKVVTDADIFRLSGKHYAQIVGEKYMQCLWPKLHFQAGTVLFRNHNGCAGLGLQNFSSSPPLSNENIMRLQRLTPHLVQAVHIRQRINLLEKANHAFEAVLKHVRLGVMLLDSHYRVTFINPEAMRAFSKCTTIDYQLHQTFKLNNKYLHQNNFGAAEEIRPKNNKRKIMPTENCMKIDYLQGHLKLSFFRIGDEQAVISSMGKNESNLPANARYLIFIQDSCRPCNLPTHYLKQAYGITPAESELITYITNGASLVEAAEMREITHETARWQMKNIMHKTGAHSQTQLALMMLSL